MILAYDDAKTAVLAAAANGHVLRNFHLGDLYRDMRRAGRDSTLVSRIITELRRDGIFRKRISAWTHVRNSCGRPSCGPSPDFSRGSPVGERRKCLRNPSHHRNSSMEALRRKDDDANKDDTQWIPPRWPRQSTIA
jgi:hypothetical protein